MATPINLRRRSKRGRTLVAAWLPMPPLDDTPPSLTLLPSLQANRSLGAGFRISIAVTAANHVDPAVFLYRARPPLPDSTDQYAAFQRVCTPADLQQFPVGQPWPDDDPAWFRLAAVTLDCRSHREAMTCQSLILEQAQQLLDALLTEAQLAAETPVTLTAINPFES